VAAVKEGQTYVLNGPPVSSPTATRPHSGGFRPNPGNHERAFAGKGTALFPVVKIEGLTGSEARYGCQAVFQDYRVPGESLLGQEGMARGSCRSSWARSVARLPPEQWGWARGPRLRRSLRQGSGPIRASDHPISGHPIPPGRHGDPGGSGRHLLYKAASLFDQASKDAFRFAAMAKYFATDAALAVSSDGVQIAGDMAI